MKEESATSANKRIAKNTLYLYIHQFLSLLLGLYTSRIVLQVLGVSDFGIFSVVGGVLAMFTFVSGSLSSATSRFLNVEMGKENGDVNKVFNINLSLHTILALIIFVLAETVGLYYVYHFLVVPEGKLPDAVFVYQISIITVCLGIMNTPFASLFNAHEDFFFTTAMNILNLFIQLFCVFMLQLYTGSYPLRLYAVLMSLTTVNTFVVYHWVGARRWPEIVKLKLIKGWEHYKPVLSFGGWNLLSTISFMARSSGSDLLLNSFFGTAVNGAYAVSRTVNRQINAFSVFFDAASGPQIIQSYSAGNFQRCQYIVNKLGRVALLLFELAFFPLYIELEFVLHLWLGEVPPGVLTFCRINMILLGVSLSCGGIGQLVSAGGKLKWFKLNLSFFFLMCIPIGYVLFRLGYSQYSLLILFIFADIFQRIVQLFLLKRILNFDSMKYVREAYVKPVIIALIMGCLLWAYSLFDVQQIAIKSFAIIVCFLLTASLIYKIGLTKGERYKLVNIIRRKLCR